MERARALIEPYVGREGVVGAYLVGSATRPHRDPQSDLDIEIVVEDETYAGLGKAERHVLVFQEGEPKRVDHEFYLWPWGEFLGLVDSRQDLFHYPYQHAEILHDPEGRLAPVVRALGSLPDDVREERMRVHLLEFLFGVGRARKTWERGGELNARLVADDALRGLVKLLFLIRGSWPSTRHWTEEELELLDVPAPLVERLRAAASDPDVEALSSLTTQVRAWIGAEGLTQIQDLDALSTWAFLTREGKSAFERWGGS